MRALLGGTILLLAAACSGGGGGGARPRPPGPGSAPDAGVAAPIVTGPTDRECEALIAHAIELRMAELAQTLPPDRLPTGGEQAALKTELAGQFTAECRGGSRLTYECAIAAKSLAELAGCRGGDQAIRSSSTSNSSVAPGGILPPAAPRSP